MTMCPEGAMLDLLWVIAQHKYGWAHCPNIAGRVRRLQTAEALERRGLVKVDRSQPHMPTCSATDAGRAEIERRWPVSPFALGTYDHQPGGWTPKVSPPDGRWTDGNRLGTRRDGTAGESGNPVAEAARPTHSDPLNQLHSSD